MEFNTPDNCLTLRHLNLTAFVCDLLCRWYTYKDPLELERYPFAKLNPFSVLLPHAAGYHDS